MSNVKHSIANRLFAVILALVMVVGMLPTTALQAEAVETEWITITVKDGEGNPIEGAAIQATLTESDGTTPVFSGGFVTNAEGIAKIHVYSVDGQLLSATITAEGYQDASLAASTVDAEHLNFDVAMTATQTPQPPQTPKIEDVTIVAKSNLVYTGVAQDLVSVTEVEGDVITYEVDGGAASDKAQGVDAKSYSVKVTVKRTGYEDLVETVTATIAPAEITGISIQGKSIAYNENEQELVTLTGSFEQTDEVIWTVNTVNTGSRDVPTGLAVGIYNITLTVNRANHKQLVLPVTTFINDKINIEGMVITGYQDTYQPGVEKDAVTITGVDLSAIDYTLEYQMQQNTGNVQAPADDAWVSICPKVSQAGNYIVWVRAVKDGFNPTLAPMAPYNVYIAKAEVEAPAKDTTPFTYNTEAQTYTVAASDLYTVAGNVQTNAGTHKVTISLNDPSNYQWVDGDSEALEYDFVINKAAQKLEFASDIPTKVEVNKEDATKNVYDYSASGENLSGSDVVYSLVDSSWDNVAEIDATGKVSVKGAGIVTVKATRAGNNNYEAVTIYSTLVVTAPAAGLITFPENSKEYVRDQNGVASEMTASKTETKDAGDLSYKLDKTNVGLIVGDTSGKVTVSNNNALNREMGRAGSTSVVVTANKTAGTVKANEWYFDAQQGWMTREIEEEVYPASNASYTLYVVYAPAPDFDEVCVITDPSDTGWYNIENKAVITPKDSTKYSIALGTAENFKSELKIDEEGQTTQVIFVKDEQTGRISSGIEVPVKVDYHAPEVGNMDITYSDDEKNTVGNTIFYKPNVTVTFLIADEHDSIESEIAYIKWFYTRSVNVSESNVASENGEILNVVWDNDLQAYKATLTLPKSEAQQLRGNISFIAYDGAGNESEEKTDLDQVIVVDNIAPTMKAEHTLADNTKKYQGVETNGVTKHYYNGDVVYTITITEANFYPKEVEVKVNGVAYTPDNVDPKNRISWNSVGDVHTGTFTLTEEGDYTITIAYEDYSENVMVDAEAPDEEIRLYTSEVITIDKTPPVIEFNYDETKQEATIKVTEHNFRATEMALVIAAKNIKGVDVTTTDLLKFLQTEANWTKDGDVYTLVLDSTTENKELLDAIYQLTIGYTDLALNPAVDVDTGKFTVDHTAPDASKITIEYADATFIDKVLNTITLGFYKPNVKVIFTAYDITSGIKEFHWSYARATGASETNLAVDSGTVAAVLDGDKATATITLPRDQAMQLRGNITVDVVDFCGNGGDDSKKVDDLNIVIIDTIAPEISVGYNAPANTVGDKAYYNGDVAVEITVTEANFFAEDVIVKVSKNGAAAEAVTPSWSDETVDVHKGTFTIKGDGHYIVSIEYTDKSDNFDAAKSSYTSHEITIDETAPVINVAYSNNSAANDKYFNAGRTATITITEHNFDKDKVIFTQNAARGGVVPTVSWSSSGDTHTATFVYSKDGDYTFDVTMTDLATNASAAANYGNSVDGKDFVIDTTFEDMISQSGVENGVAYGHDAEVVPNIKISDINLDEYTITLTGVQKDTTIDLSKDVNALLKKNTETVTGVFDVFEVVQNLDGIYTLKMTSKDKAGNEDSMEIVFTVNRFGSVYVFEDYLLNLVKDNGAFVQEVDSDLVITEFNADRLVADSLKIEITVDGKPLENVQYTVTPEINDTVSVGSSGWYQYKYTISKDNFAADGVYKISISSEDATGNTPENSNYEDKGMTFRVDSTKAEISSVVGLEEAIINAQEITVKYTIFDTIGIKSIMVYVDGKPVDEITDFTADSNNYSGSFTLAESSAAQAVRIVVEDMAGNITDTNAEDFAPAYEFNGSVTVSTNIFVRWYANKPLFWGSIGGVVVVAGALWFFLASKKKKKEEATAK